MQKTNFKIEILLRDDASTDGTTEIVNEYSVKYPDIIKPLIYEENQYVKGVSPFKDNVIRAKGKYIAICEGDDYWTDPLKLQKQVDFLEANVNYVLCFHDVKILQPSGILVYDFITSIPKDIKLDQKTLVVNSNFIHTPSVMFRREYLKDMPSIYASPVGDYLLYLWLTNFGDIGYISESMGVYRYGVGVHSLKSKEKKAKEWFWVLLIGTFLVKKPENIDYLEYRLVRFLKQADVWDDLIYDYSFKEGVKKFLVFCNKVYLNEEQENVNNMSTRMIFRVIRDRFLNKFSKFFEF